MGKWKVEGLTSAASAALRHRGRWGAVVAWRSCSSSCTGPGSREPPDRVYQVHCRFEVGGGIYSDETVGGEIMCWCFLFFDKSKPDLHRNPPVKVNLNYLRRPESHTTVLLFRFDLFSIFSLSLSRSEKYISSYKGMHISLLKSMRDY
jgi:hypothetical protein